MAKFNKISSGYQPCQLVKNNRRFTDHLRPYYQDLNLMGTDMVPETSIIIFNRLTRLIVREDSISLTLAD
jgi:hypothetical protein